MIFLVRMFVNKKKQSRKKNKKNVGAKKQVSHYHECTKTGHNNFEVHAFQRIISQLMSPDYYLLWRIRKVLLI